jgi:hypothetical protein
MPLAHLICTALILTAASCAAKPEREAHLLTAIEERHQAELDAFHAEQRRIGSSEDVPGVLEFGDLGELHVHSVELVGWPSSAILRADFTWVNTGKRTRNAPTVRLSIIDEAGDDWRSEALELGGTHRLEFGTGSTHSTWLRVATDGLHLRPNWAWGLELVEPGEDESLALP